MKLDAWSRPISPNQPRALLALFAQRILMLLLVVSYLISLMMVYRPRAILDDDPRQHALAYSEASFTSDDGVPLAGWWIDASKLPRGTDPDLAADWGKRTVVLCHGIGSAGNVSWNWPNTCPVAIQRVGLRFRGHGEGRELCSAFAKRSDALAAIAGLRQTSG